MSVAEIHGDREVTEHAFPCLCRWLADNALEGVIKVGSASHVGFLGTGRQTEELVGLIGRV